MGVLKFTVLTLLLIPILFFLLNGCGDGNGDPDNNLLGGSNQSSEILRVVLDKGLKVNTASEITDIKFHGNWLVVSNLFEIQIYGVRENKLFALLTGHPGIVQTVALSEDSQSSFFIAAGCLDGTIRIWNAKDIKEQLDAKQSSEVLIFAKENEDYYQDIENAHTQGVITVTFSNKDKKILASRAKKSPNQDLRNSLEMCYTLGL